MDDYVVGLDTGNSESTLIHETPGGRMQHRTIPSYIGSGDRKRLETARQGDIKDVLLPGEFVLEYGREYFIGDLALRDTKDATSGRDDITRYWNGHTLKLLLVLAGTTFVKPTVTRLRVVTGLPYTVWTKENVTKVRRSLMGEHRFVLNGRERCVYVESVLVLMEGAGALIAHGRSDEVHQAVVDVGGRTTDLYWAYGQKPIASRCAGIAQGVENVADLLNARVGRQGLTPLSPEELRDTLHAYVTDKKSRPIYRAGAPLQLNGDAEHAINDVAADIVSFVTRIWDRGDMGKPADDAAHVLLIGGGAHYFARTIRSSIPHIHVPKYPELANAMGYLSFGLRASDETWIKGRL